MNTSLKNFLKWGAIGAFAVFLILIGFLFFLRDSILSCNFQQFLRQDTLPDWFKCTGQKRVLQDTITIKSVIPIPQSDISCPTETQSIYATGTETIVGCQSTSVPQYSNPGISIEKSPYVATKNLINLSDEASEKIVQKLLIKRTKEGGKYENPGMVLIQGDWEAIYSPPVYPDSYDSIRVSMSGKTYNLPGFYGKVEREIYLKEIANKSCPLEITKDSSRYDDKENVVIEGKRYAPPNYLSAFSNCFHNMLSFYTFDSFSPSGHYLLYQVSGYEYSESRLVDIQTGKSVLTTDNSISSSDWTPDRKRFIFYISPGMGGGKDGGLNITNSGAFPKHQRIEDGLVSKSLYVDEKYIYILEDYSDFYLRILDINTFEEVYRKVVKK